MPFSALLCFVCVCVFFNFLIVFYLCCRITRDVALLFFFCTCALKRTQAASSDVKSVKLFLMITPGALTPNHMNGKLSLA